MGASSSCCFYIAKPEESPCTGNDGVAELEMVGAEGVSTSGRSEYYSERCEAMMRSRDQFSDDVALDIEFSKPHWSEVNRRVIAPQSAEEEELNRENRELCRQLEAEHPFLFGDEHFLLFRFDPDSYVLGRMIGEGGQAEIYEVVGDPDNLLKVFKRGTSLRDLRRSWPLPVLNAEVRQCIRWAGLLKDGRFAFLMKRCWGDLRKLIDQAMQEKNVHGIQAPPFPYKWKDYERWTFHSVDFMLGIAEHMRDLHKKNVSHRDLKASNVLLQKDFGRVLFSARQMIVVADFECSIGVMGTGFWRAPEILASLGKLETITNEQWKKADVYSYGMICFELVTGKLLFDGELKNSRADRQLVIDGKRPHLPSDLDVAMKDLIIQCWETNPSSRPTFSEIVHMVETISTKLCQFRLFRIGDELPLQYHLATVQEVKEYPIALMKATPKWVIANLANGSVDTYDYGMRTRLERRSDADHKLARLQH